MAAILLGENMADLKEREYLFCSLCRQNHDQGRKHIYTRKHKNNLDNILKKFLKKVSAICCSCGA